MFLKIALLKPLDILQCKPCCRRDDGVVYTGCLKVPSYLCTSLCRAFA